MRTAYFLLALLPAVAFGGLLSDSIIKILITSDGGDPFSDLTVPVSSSSKQFIPTEPAADCLQRALNLTTGCQPFLKVLNDNGGQLSLMTVFQVLEVAKGNGSATYSCYQKTLKFFNGGCVCDDNLIKLVQNLPDSTAPQLVKDVLKTLNTAKCPKAPAPSDDSSSSDSPPPPSDKSKNVTIEVKKG